MRVVVDARVTDGEPGGVQQSLLGLASGLAVLDEDGDEYFFLVYADHDWLRPVMTGPCRPLIASPEVAGPLRGAVARRSEVLGKVVGYLAEARGRTLPAEPKALLDGVGADVVHFMRQRGFATQRPNLYQPHDLQHVHHPEFFHPLTRAYRQRVYRAMAHQATRVAVMTSTAVPDVVNHLGVTVDQVAVVPWASGLSLSEPAAVPPGLPQRYALYPAQSWPHKNHARLVQALGRLRREGLDVPVVLTGRRNAHWPAITTEIERHGVGDLVIALDYVEAGVLHGLYRGAHAVVLPTLYEGWGLPLVEALEVGVPVACSAITPLREIAGEAALLFDPSDVGAIASAIATVWCDEPTRRRLIDSSAARMERFSWLHTAELFRAHYRAIAGVRLGPRDQALLAAAPLV